MKYALIGCGRISINHIEAAIENNLEIVGICDIREDRMKEAKEKHPQIESVTEYTDYIEMIKKEKPELVAIATESGKHAKIALDCLDLGVNLIIEKPIALSLSDADKIIEKAEEKKLKVCACHQNRFNKAIQTLRDAVEDNRFGRIFNGTANIRWNRNKSYYEHANWRGTWEQDGGALMNQCIHCIDLLYWMMGSEIDEVCAFTDNFNHDYIEVEDLGVAILKFKNGSFGIIEGTTNVYPKNLEETLTLFGEKGTVQVGGTSVNKINIWKIGEDDEQKVIEESYVEHKNVYGVGHSYVYADMISAITKGTKLYVDAVAGKKALELVLAIYKSAHENRIVKYPIGDSSTLDFKKDK